MAKKTEILSIRCDPGVALAFVHLCNVDQATMGAELSALIQEYLRLSLREARAEILAADEDAATVNEVKALMASAKEEAVQTKCAELLSRAEARVTSEAERVKAARKLVRNLLEIGNELEWNGD